MTQTQLKFSDSTTSQALMKFNKRLQSKRRTSAWRLQSVYYNIRWNETPGQKFSLFFHLVERNKKNVQRDLKHKTKISHAQLLICASLWHSFFVLEKLRMRINSVVCEAHSCTGELTYTKYDWIRPNVWKW